MPKRSPNKLKDGEARLAVDLRKLKVSPSQRTMLKLASILGDADVLDAARSMKPKPDLLVFPFRAWRPRGDEGEGDLVSGWLKVANPSHFAFGQLLSVDTFSFYGLNSAQESFHKGSFSCALLAADMDSLPAGFDDWDAVYLYCRETFPHAFTIRSRSGKAKLLFPVATGGRMHATEALATVLRFLLRDTSLFAACDVSRSGLTTTFLSRAALDDFGRQSSNVRLAGNVFTLAVQAREWALRLAAEQPQETAVAVSPLASLPGLWSKRIPELWHTRRDARASSEAVLRAVMQHATVCGRKLRLSQKAIAKLTGLSLATVNARIKEFLERGWLTPDYDISTKYIAGEQAMSYVLSDMICEIITWSGVELPVEGTPRPQRALPPPPGRGGWEEYALPAARAYRRLDDLLRHACSLDGIFDVAGRLSKFVRAWRRVWRREEMPTRSFVNSLLLSLSVPPAVTAHVEQALRGLAA